MTTDTQGYTHVLYGITDKLFYGSNASGVWAYEPLTLPLVENSAVQKLAFTIDTQGDAHFLAYFMEDGKDWYVGYGTNKSGTWKIEKITPREKILPPP